MTDFVRMRELIRLEERYRWALERQMAKATKITTSISQAGKTGGGKTGSQVEENAVILAEIRSQHEEIEKELDEMRDELRGTLKRLRSEKVKLEKNILKLRYMKGISVRKIANTLNYSEDYMFQKMKQAEALIINMQRTQEHRKKKTVHLG